MTLSQFLEATADTPADRMRCALTHALAAGVPWGAKTTAECISGYSRNFAANRAWLWRPSVVSSDELRE